MSFLVACWKFCNYYLVSCNIIGVYTDILKIKKKVHSLLLINNNNVFQLHKEIDKQK